MTTYTKHRLSMVLNEMEFKIDQLPEEYLKEYLLEECVPLLKKLTNELNETDGKKV